MLITGAEQNVGGFIVGVFDVIVFVLRFLIFQCV